MVAALCPDFEVEDLPESGKAVPVLVLRRVFSSAIPARPKPSRSAVGGTGGSVPVPAARRIRRRGRSRAGLRRTHPGPNPRRFPSVLRVPSPLRPAGRLLRSGLASAWGWFFAVDPPAWAFGVWCWLRVGAWSGVPVCRFASVGCRRAAWRGCAGGRVVRRLVWPSRGWRWVRSSWSRCPGVRV